MKATTKFLQSNADDDNGMKIVPSIKKTRTRVDEYEECPYCQKEIGEKEISAKEIDGTTYWFHRPCFDSGPIGKTTREESRKALEAAGWGTRR